MKTWFSESAVSERIAAVPSGETASTLPAVPTDCETAVPLKIIKPFWPNTDESTPRNALLPLRSNKMEFGENVRTTGFPAAKAAVEDAFVIRTMVALQAALVGFAVAHAVV